MCGNRTFLALGLLLMLWAVGGADAQNLQTTECSVAGRIPRDSKVYHVGSYGGTSGLGAAIELDNKGHDVRKIDVLVNLPDEPIVLVLSAYDPVVWNVAWTAGTRIVAAVVSGYHGQAVLGISKSIPLYVTTFAGAEHDAKRGASSSCPFFYAYKQDNEYPKAADAIRRITGLEVARFIQAPEKGAAIVGGPVSAALSAFESSPDYRLEEFVLTRKPGEAPAGPRGMEELAKLGFVRHAMPEDIRSFEESGVKGIIRGMATYVILKPLTMPDGLYGGNSVNILLPAGVPDPDGPRGHNSFFRFGQPKCVGPGC